jgi:hypothetical protein
MVFYACLKTMDIGIGCIIKATKDMCIIDISKKTNRDFGVFDDIKYREFKLTSN